MHSPLRRSHSFSSEDGTIGDESMIPLYYKAQANNRTTPPEKPTKHRRHALLAGFVIGFAAMTGFIYSARSSPSPSPSLPLQGQGHLDANRKVYLNQSAPLWHARAERVKNAFVHAYDAYEKYAFPMDELMPLSRQGQDSFNGWAVTAVDSIDTMLLMNLTDQYGRARAYVETMNINNTVGYVGMFETIIRHLGGYLSAYVLTGDELYKQRADELGQFLLPAFDTPSGLPRPGVNVSEGGEISPGGKHHIVLAELGTLQMEFKYLTRITGNPVYFQKAEHITDVLAANIDPLNSMLPMEFDVTSGKPSQDRSGALFSAGAGSDSAYEYFLKQYLMTAKSEPKLLDLYLKTMKGIIENLVYLSPNRKLMWITDTQAGVLSGVQEHLTCFFPGLLALGTATLNLSPEDRDLHLAVAEGLTETCFLTYADQATGVGAEIVAFDETTSTKWIDAYRGWLDTGAHRKGTYPPGVAGGDLRIVKDPEARDYVNAVPGYFMRPEAIESVFIMYRVTGNEIWRERGWQMFEAIDRYTRGEVGFSCIKGIDSKKPKLLDDMRSYFLAETLKYFYLLFQTDPNLISLDQYVFNTEAHPLPIYQWSAKEASELLQTIPQGGHL